MQDFTEISGNELALVDGGTLQSFGQTLGANVRHGLYEGYRTAVSYPTAAIAGWKLAGQMYGAKVTMHDRVRAMGEVHHVLAASDSLPAFWKFGHK
jgi:hypothetical protein